MSSTLERTAAVARPTVRGHVAIARIDHWVKNVFILPGIVTAVGSDGAHVSSGFAMRGGDRFCADLFGGLEQLRDQ